MNKTKLINWLHILLPLLAGVLIYVLFRVPVTRLHTLLGIKHRWMELPPFWGRYWILYHFTDMCWAYSLTYSLCYLGKSKPWESAAICIVGLSFLEWRQGNFSWGLLDLGDLFYMILASVIAYFILNKKQAL